MTKQSRILYWPGMHRNSEELLDTLETVTKQSKSSLHWLKEPYDIGVLPNNRASDIHRFIEKETTFNWWIGLSLGAAVAFIVAASVSKSKRPKRITLINIFHDRKDLAKHKSFSLDDQWPLRPLDFIINSEIKVDLVVSKKDEKIPPSYSLNMMAVLNKYQINLIELDADHQISSLSTQKCLAKLLLH